MGKLVELWRSPYPTFYQRWKAVVIPSAIIFLILYILQPFGISRIKGSVFGVVAGSALIAAGASGVFTYLLPALFPAYYKEQNWTLGKHVLNLLLMLLLIAVGIWAYQSWLMGMWLDKRLFFLALSWVMVLAPFPTIFFLMWNRNLQLTRNLKEAMEMNGHLSRRISPEVGIASLEDKVFSSEEALVFAGLVTVGFLLLLYLPRRVIGFKDFMNSVPEGGKLMMPAILILVLAWTLKGMTDALGIGTFVRSAINLNSSLMNFVPLIIFCIAIFIAFSSGTSWGTFAIFVPIVVNMFAELDPTMMIISVAAVLAGAVCGDHISPISDTTIMSSSGAQSNHINHVQTQMQYAFVVIAVCVVGYLIAGFTENWWLTLLCSLVILTGVLLEIRKREMCGR